MTLEAIRQTTEAIEDTTKRYEEIYTEKEKILKDLETAKYKKDKKQIKTFKDKLISLDYNLAILKKYITTLITNLQKLVEEEKNAL
jgi:mevalonate kinase